ncbi:MAG TPA: ABC transporter substrate-binding protein [Burkholderiaceae bacterium]|nr:ABC transporter substrate-binding protein [Burkholderiaceae bacterium]
MRIVLSVVVAVASWAVQAQPTSAPGENSSSPPKVLRYAFRIAETGFDPAQISDYYSRTIAANIFDAPLEYDYLPRPVQVQPNTAAALPEISPDYKTLTVRIRPGIYFDDDPAFNGRKRELTAHDYVYSFKRHFDPRWKSPTLYVLENAKVLGLAELRREALERKQPFDYDREVPGLRALDRYTFQIRFAEPQPRFYFQLADPSVFGAIAREVVEAYGDKIMEKPVGTGPFRLAQWKRSSKIVLERNPNYRNAYFDSEAPGDDAAAQAVAKRLRGRKLPLLDRVEISIIEENQPRWLAFVNGEHDFLEEVPTDFANLIIPNNELAPNLKRRGIRMDRYTRADISVSYFGMENPVVGGYTPEKVALRRAISLAVNLDEEIRLVRRNQAIPAQSFIGPNTWGYDPDFRSEMSVFDRARARALLDLYGYLDRDGDGWREQPDGSPLTIEYTTQPDDQSRQLIEQWRKNMDAIGIRMIFKVAKWPENLKASRAGKLMMWGVGWLAVLPDAQAFLDLCYGPNKGQANHARFDLPAYNRLYEKQIVLPNGPERAALVHEAKKLTIAYMPYKVHVHRVYTDLTQPWVFGAKRNIFKRDFWKFVDIDPEKMLRTDD